MAGLIDKVVGHYHLGSDRTPKDIPRIYGAWSEGGALGVHWHHPFNEIADGASGDFEVWKVVKVDGDYKCERVKIISL